MERKNKKILIFILLVILIYILNKFFKLSSYLNINKLIEIKSRLNDNIFYASLVYIFFTIIGSVFFALPGITFAMIAGILFGAVYGTFLCTFSASLGAILSFIIGRYFLQEKLKPIVIKNKYIKKYLFDDINKSEVFILMLTRLVPIFPFNLQNFAYGITNINFFTYSIFSFIFILPGTAMYTVAFASISNPEKRNIYIISAIIIAIIVFFLAFIFKKYIVDKEANNG